MRCDDYLDDPSSDRDSPLYKFIEFHRQSAMEKLEDRSDPDFNELVLFATTQTTINPLFGDPVIEKGTRVRVTMASRLGDLGITTRLHIKQGYAARCRIEDLTDFTTTRHSS